VSIVPKLSDENDGVEGARAAGRWVKISPSIAFAVSIPSWSDVVLLFYWKKREMSIAQTEDFAMA
jgi:hypothetical protein